MPSTIPVARGPRVVIGPPGRTYGIGLRDIINYRDLLYFLAWRDVKVRYTQAALGLLWAVLQPVLMMAVFAVFLGRFAGVPSPGLPYAAFAFAGLVPWTFFVNAVGGATQSLVTSANLVSKVYFPRLVVPLAAILAWIPDLIVASLVLVAALPLFGLTPGLTALALPLCAVGACAAVASVSIGLAGLNVTYRDVRYAVPFALQVWLFLTPVVYPVTVVPERVQPFVGLNPMTGVVEAFRWSVFGRGADVELMGVSAASAAFLFTVGAMAFRRMESRFADVI